MGCSPPPEPRDRLTVGPQLAVREVPHSRVRNPAEGGPPDLGADLVLGL